MNRANNSVSSFELSVGRDVYDTPRSQRRIPLTMSESLKNVFLFLGNNQITRRNQQKYSKQRPPPDRRKETDRRL